jgi:predicted RNA binding protein YcfA (HicA-like mRNA interferase family)
MPSRSLADLNQNDWVRASRKLGLTANSKSGKGSHLLIKHPSDSRKYTIQRHLHKAINRKIFKKLLEWGFTDEQIWEALS